MLWGIVSICIAFVIMGSVLLIVSAVLMWRQSGGETACPAIPDIERPCDDFEMPSFNGFGQRISFRGSKTGKL